MQKQWIRKISSQWHFKPIEFYSLFKKSIKNSEFTFFCLWQVYLVFSLIYSWHLTIFGSCYYLCVSSLIDDKLRHSTVKVWRQFVKYLFQAVAVPGFFLGGGAPLRNDRWGKQILKANTKNKAWSQGRGLCTLPLDPPLLRRRISETQFKTYVLGETTSFKKA